MSNSSTSKPTLSVPATGSSPTSTSSKPTSPSAPFNYAAAAKKSKPSPAAVTSGDVAGYVNGASSAGASPTVPAATAIAQAAGGGSSTSGATSPQSPAPSSRKQSVRVDGVSVPQSRVDAIRSGAESDGAFLPFLFADREQANRNSNLQSLSVPPTIRTLYFRLPLPLLLRSTTVLPKRSVQFQLKLPVPLPLLRLPSLLSTFTPSSLEEDRRTLATLLLPLHLSRLNEDR